MKVQATTEQGFLLDLVRHHASTVVEAFSQLRGQLRAKMRDDEEGALATNPFEEIERDFDRTDFKDEVPNTDIKELAFGSEPQASLDYPGVKELGHFLPLYCGHNGYLSHYEKLAYEEHLLRSGLLSDNPSLYSLGQGQRESLVSSQTVDMLGDPQMTLTTQEAEERRQKIA